MTSEALQSFVRGHPDFFRHVNGYWSLREDLQAAMEHYAISVDAEEYERISALIEQVRAEERNRLWELVGRWREELQACEERLQTHRRELRGVEQQVARALDVLSTSYSQRGGSRGLRRKWYHSGIVYWALAFFGVLGVYLGILLQGSAAFSFLLAGASAVGTGGYLQMGDTRRRRAEEEPVGLSEEGISMHEKLLRLARVKRAALLERKRVALRAHASLSERLEDNHRKIKSLNG